MIVDQIDNYKFRINLEHKKIGRFVKSLPLISFSDKLKKGLKEEIVLRDGLKIVINEYNLKKPVFIDFSINNAPLEFAFCLSGKMDIIINSQSNGSETIQIQSGACSIFFLPNVTGKIKIYDTEKVLVLSLHISPDYLKEFLTDNDARISKSIEESIWNKQKKHFVLSGKISTAMQLSANQILEKAKSPATRKMFLESKSLELMSLLIDDFFYKEKNDESIFISKNENEILAQLKEFIENNLADLPRLDDLARKVGMTHTKLNKMFKYKFGATVFVYVRELRQQKAEEMLLSESTLTDIAYKLGYSSPSHFSKEFFAKHNITPNEYRRNYS